MKSYHDLKLYALDKQNEIPHTNKLDVDALIIIIPRKGILHGN